MDYATFLRTSQSLQAEYIRKERRRYKKALKMYDRYVRQMAFLELHPLRGRDIYDRLHQLDDMEKRIPESHGDTEGQRAVYEARWGKIAA